MTKHINGSRAGRVLRNLELSVAILLAPIQYTCWPARAAKTEPTRSASS